MYPFRFYEDMVSFSLSESHYLVFDAGTIPGSGRLNLAGVHRRTGKVFVYDSMHSFVGIRNVAIDLRHGQAPG